VDCRCEEALAGELRLVSDRLLLVNKNSRRRRRKEEEHINSFPNFTTDVKDDDGTVFHVHFTALFSSNPDAIPIAFFHGWPGSFLEFLPLMDLLRSKHTPETLPYHIIAPSLLGFGLSGDPPLDRDWKTADTARIMHKLLLTLGFGARGYLAQGGDIGSLVARSLAAHYAECKGMHVNFMHVADMESKASPADVLSAAETRGLDRMHAFKTSGRAYAIEHGTRPATIGLVLASSPLAQLAWIAEKFLAWSDPASAPPLDAILAHVSLYCLAGCYPSSIYSYRDAVEAAFVDKPTGYSWFPFELMPVPRAWAERTANVVHFNAHERGGHFAALEVPEALWADVEAYVELAWK
jgi:microsomal epoxide hydrolase